RRRDRRFDEPGMDFASRPEPSGLYEDEWERERPQRRRPRPGREQRRRRPSGPSRHDRIVEQPRMQAQAIPGDVVTDIRPLGTERPAPRTRHRNPAWSWKPIVL